MNEEEFLQALGDALAPTNILLSNLCRIALAIPANLNKVIPNPADVKSRRELVTTAGTAIQLSGVKIPNGYEVKIRALSTNTGVIYVARSKVDAEDITMCYQLGAGTELKIKIDNLNRLWITSSVSNEGISWIVEQMKTDI